VSEAVVGSRYLNIGTDLRMEETEDYLNRMICWVNVLAEKEPSDGNSGQRNHFDNPFLLSLLLLIYFDLKLL